MKIDVFVSLTGAFLREVERLNKKAARIGVPLITLEDHGRITKRRYVITEESERSYPVEVSHFTVTLPEDADRKWETVAKITPIEGEQAFVESLKVGYDASPWKLADPQNCDQCHTRRHRNVSYIVRNTETGKFMQLGSKCFADYFGTEALRFLEFRSVVVVNLSGDEEGFYPRGSTTADVCELRHAVAMAEAVNAFEGWRNNEKSPYSDELLYGGTHRLVGAHFNINSRADSRHTDEARTVMLQAGKDKNHPAWALADAAISRLQALDIPESDDFGRKLKELAEYQWIPVQKASLVAYIGQYLRQIDQRAALEAKKAKMCYVGTVGQRGAFRLRMVRLSGYNNDFGHVNVNVLEDRDGNELVWKTGTWAFEVGKEYDLKGTIKKHSDKYGYKQTILTRCRVA